MSINFPATTTLLVNTWNTSKIVYLPAASTIGGKLLYIKDICGNSANSTIYISTKGLDTIENNFRPSTLYGFLSTNFASVLLAPDGRTNWMILQNYVLNGVAKGSGSRNFPFLPTIYLQALTYSGSGTWFDSSTNGFNATIENGTAAKNSAGNGIVLNGSTNWIFNNIQIVNLWTCCVWYKSTGGNVGGNPCILTQIYTGGAFAICLGYGASVGYQFYAPGWQTGTSISLSYTSWTNYYGVWNGSSLVTYINGVSVGSVSIGTADTDGGNQWRIGRRWDYPDYMVGEIGEVVIFKTAFTAAQVLNDFTIRRSVYGV
jgi:hypothetical protein